MRIDQLAMQRAKPLYERYLYEQRMEQKARLDRLSAAEPRFAEIDRELRMAGPSAMRAAFGISAGQLDEIILHVLQTNLALQDERAALLEKIGYPADYLTGGAICSACDDSGFLPDGRICDCLRRFYRDEQRKLLEESGITSKAEFHLFFRRLIVDDQNPIPGPAAQLRGEQYDRCERFADELRVKRGNLLLEGPSGCGKSMLAACIARRAVDHGLSVAYASALDYVTQCDNERFRRDEAAGDYIGRCQMVDLLILDDLGSEPSGNYNNAYLLSLLQQRENHGGSTVICTLNATGKGGLFERMSPPVVSRLRGDFEHISINGRDLRSSADRF